MRILLSRGWDGDLYGYRTMLLVLVVRTWPKRDESCESCDLTSDVKQEQNNVDKPMYTSTYLGTYIPRGRGQMCLGKHLQML